MFSSFEVLLPKRGVSLVKRVQTGLLTEKISFLRGDLQRRKEFVQGLTLTEKLLACFHFMVIF